MTKKLIAVIGGALILGGIGWFARKKLMKPPKTSGRVVQVATDAIEETVEATGSVVPLNRVEIKPPISGRIEKLIVDEGRQVQEGQILAWMSSSDRAAILDAARAQGPEELKHWEDSYKPTPIVAPLSGVIILRNVVVGQTVDPSVVLYAMSDFLVVQAQVDESDIGRIHMGMEARTVLDAYPDRKVEGKVFDILYEGKNVSNVIQYGVKIRPNEVPGYFRSQMTANISFIVRRKENAVVVPLTAVKDRPDGSKVVSLPAPEGEVIQREVKTGIESGDRIEIVSGLEPGEQILMAQGKYVPQQAAPSSPLTFGGKPQQQGQGQKRPSGK